MFQPTYLIQHTNPDYFRYPIDVLKASQFVGDSDKEQVRELEPDFLQVAGLTKDPFEAIAMSLIFKQHKVINELLENLGKKR